uniref:dihydropteroate synthase n=3 Tax=environmental samples TaxID=68359 RepID=A0A075HN20_9EURY|nr:dihydropteroate synthase (folP) [uncultured marine group II/III euryarchaeote KM3_18_H05]AIF17279.1 dihydropteroate synthase (folP) [uncultured marine group II/III euryarchaeote KM3_76_H07]AIF18420.1 dihydropteroate synthase (folP) [uncultured marine group II/III euryarchaeote KM3_82_E01]
MRIGSLELEGRCHVMGILNVTPDSFYDGGRYDATEAAIVRGRVMAAHGADIIDVGGESTRPGAPAVPEAEERERVVPVIAALAAELEIPVSIDSRKPAVARAAVAAGAALINDVGGLRDPEMVAAVAELGVPTVVMHMRGTPETMQREPNYDDVVGDVKAWLAERVAAAEAAGISRELLIVDPGIGFGKTLDHSLALMARLDEFRAIAGGVLLGASRKSWLAALSGAAPEQRLPGSLAAATAGALAGADIVRVHDVAATRQAIDVANALREFK